MIGSLYESVEDGLVLNR